MSDLTPDAIADERKKLRELRERLGKKVGYNCDEWMCPRTVETGALHRVNPKGRPGIFMCEEHARATRESDDLGSHDSQSGAVS